jgi:hypothetical protein
MAIVTFVHTFHRFSILLDGRWKGGKKNEDYIPIERRWQEIYVLSTDGIIVQFSKN